MVALYISAKRKFASTALFEPTHFGNPTTEHPLQYSIQIVNIGTQSVRELFCSCQEEVQKWLLNERACTKVHYWDVVYLSSVEHSKSIGF